MPSTLQNLLIVVALIAVAIVLVLGLWNMMKGGSPSRSQNLMRLRVLLQAVAILVVMIVIWMLGR
jgi:FtsZ-interacting cell division protein ZipA